MVEIFSNIGQTLKDAAELSWQIALTKKNPIEMAEFLNDITNLYKKFSTEEEIEFLQFYFNMKMEMMKE